MLDPDFFRQAAPAAARVTQSTILILASAFLGARADAYFGTSPWIFFAGMAIGSALGLASLIQGLTPPDDDDPTANPPQ